MLDLSNNNAAGHDFRIAFHHGGQRRLYLKLGGDELAGGGLFVDKTYRGLRSRARRVGFKVGAYWFAHPLETTPRETAGRILTLLPHFEHDGRELRLCLDLEHGTPTAKVGAWATETAKLVRAHTGQPVVFYGSGWYLEACAFSKAPGPLWLAAYGRNDGRDYPIGRLPRPWTVAAAHQFTSRGHVAGIHGTVDISHVQRPRLLDVPARKEHR